VLFPVPLHFSESNFGWIEINFRDNDKDSLWYVPPNKNITFLTFKGTSWELEGLLLFVWVA
jgi:hypothetical protein